jgi:hypothetical protein
MYLPLNNLRILTWADQHFARTGQWPTHTSGLIRGSYGVSWQSVENALRQGLRGLPGGSSLTQFLAEHRGVRNLMDLPPLSERKILTWAKAHHERTGIMPTNTSGAVVDAPGETWGAINRALRVGARNLPGGSTLARLLAKCLGHRNRKALAPLSVPQILVWIDAHHARTGEWPLPKCGPIPEAPGETWSGISNALLRGYRGLPPGSSLAQLLRKHRQVQRRPPCPYARKVPGSVRGRRRIAVHIPTEILDKLRTRELLLGDVAKSCGVSIQTIRREVVLAGVQPVRGRGPSKPRPVWYVRRREIAQRYQAGYSYRRLERQFQLGRVAIQKALRSCGVVLRTRIERETPV